MINAGFGWLVGIKISVIIIIINCLFSYVVRNNYEQLILYTTDVTGPAVGSCSYNPQVRHNLHRLCQHER